MPKEKYVTTGKPKVAGAIYRAPAGTTLPTSAEEALNSAFVELGFVSENGVSNSNTPDTDNIKAWGGAVVLVVQNEKKDEWSFTLIEALNPNVLETVYGGAHVSYDAENGTITVQATADQPEDQSYVIDMVMKNGALKRIVIPLGALSELGEIVYKDDEPVGYEITINALMDAFGVNHYEYIKLANAESASVTLNKSSVSLSVGGTEQLTATTVPDDGHVVFGTSDPEVASVTQSGLVTAIGAGNATIMAYFAGIVASCTVSVSA